MYQRKINKGFILVMACVLVMSAVAMTGCGQQQTGETSTQEAVSVNSPVEVNCLVTNPIDVAIEDIQDEEHADFTTTKVTVTGLANESVEERVNNTISETIALLQGAGPAPFRGVKAKLGENPELTSEYIGAYVEMNANNILSLNIIRSATFGDYTMQDTKPINFDLNTGREITLKDVFCDDVDYLTYINDNVMEQLLDANADDEGYFDGNIGLSMTTPFKGIDEDQKFYLDRYSGKVVLVFDYENPEFDTNWYYVTMAIPFDGNAAYTKRFMTGDNIYTYDGPEQKQLLSIEMPFDCVNEMSLDQPRTNLYVYTSVRYSSCMPEELQRIADGFGGIDADKQDFVATTYDEYAMQYGEDSIWGSYESNVYTGKVSKYWNICENLYMNVSNNSGDASQSFATSLSQYHCYEDESIEELSLFDIFNKDADVEKCIKAAMKIQLEESEDLEGAVIKQDLLDTLYDNINGFYPGNDSLFISFGDIGSVLMDYGISQEDAFDYEIPIDSLQYKNIGCENMVIFD